MRQKRKITSLIILMVLILAGCGGPKEEPKPQPEPKVEEKPVVVEPKKDLIYGSADYTSINPALYEHGEINLLLFTGLTAHDKHNKVVPDLAKEWVYDKKTKTYTFTLREDVKWHDGQAFTAKDVKFTLEAIMNPDNGSEIASNYEEIESIEMVDDYHLKIKLKENNVAILDYLTIGILPAHLLEGKELATDAFNQFPIGTGPFKMERWDRGQSITMVRNDDYYGNKAKLEKVIFKIVADDKAKAIQLKSGELDLAQVTPKDGESFKDDKNYIIHDMRTADYRGILYNFNNPFFAKHRELPNALSYGIDRKKILDMVLLGQGEVAYSPLQAGPYNNLEIEKYDYNPAKAKEMLEKAGWVLNKEGIYEKAGDVLGFTINCMEGDQVRVDMANICAQDLKAIGADVKVEVKTDIDWENQEAFLIGWGSPFDPDDHTYKVFGTDKGANYQKYSNKKVDENLKKAREVADEKSRLKYYHAFQTELSKDLPFTFLTYIDAIYVSKSNVSGLESGTLLGHHGVGIFWNIEDWEIIQEEPAASQEETATPAAVESKK